MKKVFLAFILAIFSTYAFAFNVQLLANNKESYSRQLTNNDRQAVTQWKDVHFFKRNELKIKSTIVLQKTMTEFTKRETYCDLGLPPLLIKHAYDSKVIESNAEFYTFIAYLRNEDLIDDIFYKLLKDSADLKNDMASTLFTYLPRRPRNLNTSQNAGLDLSKIYEGYQSDWADDVKFCTIGRYFRLISKISWKNPIDLSNQMLKLNWMAAKDGHITMEAFNHLEVMRRSDVVSWPATIDGYLDVITKSKDKLTKTPELKSENHFNENYVSRKERLTRRGRLYKVFDSTQVMVLAQLIEKTAKRMDARYAALHFRYTKDPKSEEEIYVLSPMEQYRVSIRLLRKELGEVMRSESFSGTGVEYEDLIAAAFETGFIKSDELDYVLKFEDFWNPKTPRWKAYAGFAFSLAGTATFYLPPPWNIIGAIGLVISQSKIMGQPDPDSDDNWNVIL